MKRLSSRSFASWRDLFARLTKRAPKQEEKLQPEPIDEQEVLDQQKETLQSLETDAIPPPTEEPIEPKKDWQEINEKVLLTPYIDLLRNPYTDDEGKLRLRIGKQRIFETREVYDRWLANYLKKRRKELKSRLSPHQFYLTQCEGAMERPFTGEFWQLRDIGMYSCRVCTQRLFSFTHKYDSPTGHASFWNFISKAVAFKADHLTLPKVTQSYVPLKHKGVNPVKRCVCSNCGSHLGFAFDDGPPPFFKRFSINSGALHFVEKGWLTPPPDKKKVWAKKRAQERTQNVIEEDKKFENMRDKLGLL